MLICWCSLALARLSAATSSPRSCGFAARTSSWSATGRPPPGRPVSGVTGRSAAGRAACHGLTVRSARKESAGPGRCSVNSRVNFLNKVPRNDSRWWKCHSLPYTARRCTWGRQCYSSFEVLFELGSCTILHQAQEPSRNHGQFGFSANSSTAHRNGNAWASRCRTRIYFWACLFHRTVMFDGSICLHVRDLPEKIFKVSSWCSGLRTRSARNDEAYF